MPFRDIVSSFMPTSVPVRNPHYTRVTCENGISDNTAVHLVQGFLVCVFQGNDVWHWQCLEELGPPSDITQVVVKGQKLGQLLSFLALPTES